MAFEINAVLNRIKDQPGSEGFGKSRTLQSENAEGKTFKDLISDAVNSVDEAQKVSDQNVEDVVMGKSDNIHEVMIAMEKAQLSFQLMVEIRNKAIETYQELSRMQI